MYFAAMAPHHLPAGEMGLPALDTVDAKKIAEHWIAEDRPALTTFAVCGYIARASLAEAVSEARAALAEASAEHAYCLRLLLVHLQGLCETRGINHVDDESYWCWCQPHATPARLARTA